MAKLKDNLASSMNDILDVIPLATSTVTTALVATNSWLVELINDEADFSKVQDMKAKMIAKPAAAKAAAKKKK